MRGPFQQVSDNCDSSTQRNISYINDVISPDYILIEAALSGAGDAYDGLFHRYRKRIFSVCLRYCGGNHAQANDLCQETFISAFRKLGYLKDHHRFSYWLDEIAKNKCISFLRKEHTFQKALADYELVMHTMLDNEQQWTEAEIRLVKNLVMDIKNDELKETIRLFYIEGKKTSEIADIQHITQSLVTTRLNRFRTTFRKHFVMEILKHREIKE